MNLYTVEQVVEVIRDEISRLGGHQIDFCKVAKVSPSYLSDILKGKRNPNPGVLKYFNLRMEVRYANIDTPRAGGGEGPA